MEKFKSVFSNAVIFSSSTLNCPDGRDNGEVSALVVEPEVENYDP